MSGCQLGLVFRPDGLRKGAPSLGSDHGDLHAVDRRERVEQAAPLLTAVSPDPELTGRGREVERGRLELVDVHRVALDREEALLLRQPAGEPPPRVATVFAAP